MDLPLKRQVFLCKQSKQASFFTNDGAIIIHIGANYET
jgi:hypothetical protein